MRSKSRHHRQSCVRPSVSPANAEPSHFFKIILPGTIHAQDMRIPKEFLRRFENELSSEAMISVPDGCIWKMELKKSENEVWFCRGWEEFVKYYSISFGFFLMFKYEGNSQFNVVIFDVKAAEIRYPCKINSETEKRSRKRSSSSDQCGYNTRSQRRKPEEEEEEEIIDIDYETASSHGKSGNKDRSGQGHCSKTKKRSLSKKQRAMEAAQKFEPANRSFIVTIRPANLNRRYVDVPASFWKDNMGEKSPMKLQDCKGRKWEVNYAKNQTSIRIWKGWINFARANNVKQGDVCVFELIKRNNYIFRVTIFSC